MNIQINENYRLTSDSNNVVVEQRKVSGSTGRQVRNPGEEYWTPVSYHYNLEQACTWIFNRMVRDSSAGTLKSLSESVRHASDEIITALQALKVGAGATK